MNILYLIGMPGSGKTTLGHQIAQKHGWDFVDLDSEITKQQNASIKDIFKKQGESKFRKIETDLLKSLTKEITSTTVFSTGGGTACSDENIAFMKSHGYVVYLKGSTSILASRIYQDREDRPMFAGLNSREIEAKLEMLLKSRVHFYEQSHVICGIESVSTPDLFTMTLDLFTKSLF